jgi:hypothetical protein
VSNVSKRPRDDGRRLPRRTDEMARDLEFLAQRLAESREAIVHLLATEATPEDASLESSPLGPRLLRNPSDDPGPVAEGTGLPAVTMDGDSETLELEEKLDEPSATEGARHVNAARRRLMAVVLVAIGTVIVLTTLVSLL